MDAPKEAPPVDPVRSRRRAYKGISFGTTMICVGTILLLNTTGMLAWGVWWDLLKLWPVLLISLGIRLIFCAMPAPLHLLSLVGPAAVVACCFWVATGYEEAAPGSSGDLSAAAALDLDCPAPAGAASQRLDLDFAAGDLIVAGQAPAPVAGAGTAPPAGLHGTLRYLGREPRRSCGGGGNMRVSLRTDVSGLFFLTPFSDRVRAWDARLAPGVPLDLDIDLAAASADLDLRSFVLEDFTMDMAASHVVVRLGPPARRTSVRIQGAAASLEVTLPEGTCFTVTRDRVLNTLDIDAPATAESRGRRATADACKGAAPDAPRYDFRFEMPVSTITVQTEGRSV